MYIVLDNDDKQEETRDTVDFNCKIFDWSLFVDNKKYKDINDLQNDYN